MTPERYQRVVDLFQQASERTPDQRAPFLHEACAGDEGLRGEVTAMLAADERASTFLEQPPEDVAAAALAARPEALIGQRVGDFLVESRLGSGGMGEVYLAEDVRLRRKAALKLLPHAYEDDRLWLRRFEQEVRAASALNHPNIVTVYGVGQAGSRPFLATEWVEGRTLREELAAGPIGPRAAAGIAAQTASALAAAHAAGIVHRDIKPENLMRRPDGLVKVLDFGLAKHSGGSEEEARNVTTMPGLVMGTVRYMSPEQARGLATDARTDLFSLGVVLYEMLAGRQPFQGETAGDVVAEILKSEPTPLPRQAPDVPAELQRIVQKALQKDRDRRYQSAAEMAADLRGIERRLEFAEGGWTPAVRTLRRYPRAVVAVLAILLLAIAGGIWRFTRGGGGSEATHRLTILPFDTSGTDPNTEYLAGIVSEGLIDAFSRLPHLDVIVSQTSQNLDLSGPVVTGQIAKHGDSLTIGVELVDTRSRKIWKRHYQRKPDELQSVQGEMAGAIADEIHVRLSGGPDRQSTETRSAAAYQQYLLGVYYGQSGLQNRKRALGYYQEAIRLDPLFARPYAAVSALYLYLGDVGAMPKSDAAAQSLEMARTALAKDSNLSSAHSAMAKAQVNVWNWMEADREFQRAIELKPSDADAHGSYAQYLMAVGRTSDALIEAQRAQVLDPGLVSFRVYEAAILYNARRYEEALRKLSGIAQDYPKDPFSRGYLGQTYGALGRYPEALAELQKAIELLPGAEPDFQCYRGYVLAKMGRRSEALALLRKLQANPELSPAELSILYVGLGDKDRALEALKKAWEIRDSQMQYLKVEPLYDSLRGDTRFDVLLRLVNLHP